MVALLLQFYCRIADCIGRNFEPWLKSVLTNWRKAARPDDKIRPAAPVICEIIGLEFACVKREYHISSITRIILTFNCGGVAAHNFKVYGWSVGVYGEQKTIKLKVTWKPGLLPFVLSTEEDNENNKRHCHPTRYFMCHVKHTVRIIFFWVKRDRKIRKAMHSNDQKRVCLPRCWPKNVCQFSRHSRNVGTSRNGRGRFSKTLRHSQSFNNNRYHAKQ